LLAANLSFPFVINSRICHLLGQPTLVQFLETIVNPVTAALRKAPLEDESISKAEFTLQHMGLRALNSPDRAALDLASNPNSGEDGLLQVREIRDLSLTADLVALSACDTGVGALEGEEGIANLVRAFLFAGAKSVVARPLGCKRRLHA